MSDLISRQAVLELIDFYDGQNQQHFTVDNLRDDVENVPSVIPQQKKGKWEIMACDLYMCSKCYSKFTHKFKFCPNCGCAMKGELE